MAGHERGMAGHQDVGATDRSLAALLGVRLLAVARLIRIEYCVLGAAGVLVGASDNRSFAIDASHPLSRCRVLRRGRLLFIRRLSDMDCDRLNAGRTDPSSPEICPPTPQLLQAPSHSCSHLPPLWWQEPQQDCSLRQASLPRWCTTAGCAECWY
jgi:hypothetical protein